MGNDLSANGTLITEIRFFASCNFTYAGFLFCPRACNKVADALPAYGADAGLVSPAFWPDQAPAFVHNLVASDVAELFG